MKTGFTVIGACLAIVHPAFVWAQTPQEFPVSEGALRADPFIPEAAPLVLSQQEAAAAQQPSGDASNPTFSTRQQPTTTRVLHLRYGSIENGVTTGPRLNGAGYELSVGALEADGVLVDGVSATYAEGSMIQAGVATTGNETEGHGGYAPEVHIGSHYRFLEAPFLESCVPMIGGAASVVSGYERETSANLLSLGVSGGVVCQDENSILMLNAILGAGATLGDVVYGQTGASAGRREHDMQAGPSVGLRGTIALDNGLLISLAAAHQFLLDGNSVTTGEAELALPLLQFDGHAIYAGAYARAMRRSDLEGGETGGIGGGLMVGIGSSIGVTQ